NILSIEGISDGRAGIMIQDDITGEYRQIGVRVRKANGTLPGMPEYLSIGQVSEDTTNDLNFWKDISYDDTNKRVDIRYIYLNDGPFEGGWANWDQGNGQRAKRYINESLKAGMIPFFVFYNIPDKIESYDSNMEHINDTKYMEAYYKNLKFFLDICKEYTEDETVGIILEPDFLGYMLQQSRKKPNEISAVVEAAYTSGVLEKGKDPTFANNLTGLVESINYTIRKYHKPSYFGWQFNTWAYDSPEIPNQGLMHKTEFIGWEAGREFIKQVATETAKYYMDAGVSSYDADFISIDKYGIDGAYETNAATNPKDSKWLWNSDLWNNYLLYTKTLHEVTNKPVLLWQIPVGHLNSSEEPNPYNNGGRFPDLPNTPSRLEDSAPTYFFGDTFKPGPGKRLDYFTTNEANDPKIKVNGDKVTWEGHMEEAKDAGIVSILYGAGVGGSTDAVGSEPAPNDNYWWITKTQRYYKNPLLLGGNSGPSTELPLKPTLESSSLNSNGNYNLTINVQANSKATSYKLIENGATIKSGNLTSESQTINHVIANKPTGTYLYNVTLYNKDGSTTSNNITVKVNNTTVPEIDKPLKGIITVDKAQNNGNYTLTLEIPEKSKATSYNLYENDKIIKTDTVSLLSNKITVPVINKPSGEYSYRLDLINKDATTQSSILKVICTASTGPIFGVGVDFFVTSDWITGANFGITITNNTNADISNWNLEFNFDKAILSMSDVNITSNGNKYNISAKPWNNTIKKGEKLTLSGGCVGGVKNLTLYNIKFSPNPVAPPVVLAEDINCDGVVNKADLDMVSALYNIKQGDSKFNAKCDINKDGIIDIYDLVSVAKLITPGV
ncbi:MAG: cellulose binding domain-containing protein, partial [Clostridium sp.]